ncbi:MAG: ABC transporter ATP-binding protein [Candidatus Competibacteraceae bacterium]|nr:ABC transporter ATP-binding protein [Candidatus Competibacteraceae bacterium]
MKSPQPPTPLGSRWRRRLWLCLVANGLGQALTAIFATMLIGHVVDHWLHPSVVLKPTLAAPALGLLCAAALHAWLRLRERVDAERLGQDYAYRMRLALFDRLSTLSPRLAQKRGRGGLLLRFIGDLTALRQWASLGLARLSVAGTTALAALLGLAWLDAGLALAIAIPLIAGMGAALWLGGPLRRAVRETRRRQARLASQVHEQIAALSVVQVCNRSRGERQRLSRQGQRLRDAMLARAAISGRLRAITEATAALATLTVLITGVIETAYGWSTPGTVIGAMAIVHLLLPGVRDLGRAHEYWHAYQVALEKIRQFMDLPSLATEKHDAQALVSANGQLEFAGIGVHGVLEEFSASTGPGRVIAIVGPNGAGKSTLLSLAARLFDPDRGIVCLDGQNLADCTLASIRRAIGMVSDELPLLRGSIARNLRYRWRNAPDTEVARVCALCGVDQLLQTLPAGERTLLQERGANLSLGQRQRIALARALLGNPSVLLLDEPDAHLDTDSSAVLDRVLAQYRGTVLMVTHRRERLFQADEIWHLADGRLVEAGPPLRLLNSDGPTQHLFGMEAWPQAAAR